MAAVLLLVLLAAPCVGVWQGARAQAWLARVRRSHGIDYEAERAERGLYARWLL